MYAEEFIIVIEKGMLYCINERNVELSFSKEVVGCIFIQIIYTKETYIPPHEFIMQSY